VSNMNSKLKAINFNSGQEQISIDLERKILHGLVLEWETARHTLNPDIGRRLHKPLFALGDMQKMYGKWSADKNEICLSRGLVTNHAWDSIRNVLLHEMAHQLAEQVLGAGNESAHGPIFKHACELLDADPRASGTYPKLNDDPAADDHSKIMSRVKKLLALAESGNQHEAEAAMLKAHELIGKYNIEMIETGRNRNFISVFAGQPALRHFRDIYHLANLLQDFYFVRGIWVPAYVLEKEKMGSVLEISGTLKNIEIAGYVYDFIQHFISYRWREYIKTKALNRHRRTDFAVGIIEGFRTKLETINLPAAKNSNQRALISVADSLLEAYFSRKYPRTTRIRRSNSRHHDPSILKDGIREGKNLVISRGISHSETGSKRFIGYNPKN
jgi:hypothetical protein